MDVKLISHRLLKRLSANPGLVIACFGFPLAFALRYYALVKRDKPLMTLLAIIVAAIVVATACFIGSELRPKLAVRIHLVSLIFLMILTLISYKYGHELEAILAFASIASWYVTIANLDQSRNIERLQ